MGAPHAMTDPLARLARAPRRFWRDERAALSIEAAIMIPVLMFLYAAGFSWFDAYRRESEIDRASYAVSDLLSRRGDLVTPADLDGLQGVFETLVGASPEGAYMRFTELRRGAAGIEVVWSYATDDRPALTTARAQGLLRQIPTLAPDERVTLVEAYTYDAPAFNVGIRERIIANVIPTRQRYEPRLAFAPGSDRRGDSSVVPNDFDCGDDAVPVGGRRVIGEGNCS